MPVFTGLLLIVAGCALSARRSARVLAAVATLGLYLFCSQPAAASLARVIEGRYIQEAPADMAAGAIVVLAGSVLPPSPPSGETLPAENTLERCRYAAWLHGRMPWLPVLVSGGPPEVGSTPVYADVMKDDLLRGGVPASMLFLEIRSRSTVENARETSRLLHKMRVARVLLVTNAVHMWRAQRALEKLGISVTPAPCGFRPRERFRLRNLAPTWQAIKWNDELVHELMGLAWYRLRGWA